MANSVARRLAARVERYFIARSAYKFFMKDWTSLHDLDLCARVIGTMRFSRNLAPVTLTGPAGKRILVLAPHPDDEMLGPGGTLIDAIRMGKHVKVLYLTSGKPEDRSDAEARSVASKIGYETEFMNMPLGNIPIDEPTMGHLTASIADYDTDTLFLPFLLDDHDDHRRVSELLFRALALSSLKKAPEVWCYQVYTALIPNVLVDVSGAMPKKLEAVRTWKSQMAGRDWAHYVSGLNAFNSRFLATGGRPLFAEAFFVLPLAEYADLCEIYFKNPDLAYYSSAYSQARQTATDPTE
jgi:LmbE family N-acetylglucosaminyl deacetylase